MNIRIPDPSPQYDPKVFSELGRAIQVLAAQIPNAPAKDGWSTSNVTTTRILDADSTTLAEVADVLCSLIEDLKSAGYLR